MFLILVIKYTFSCVGYYLIPLKSEAKKCIIFIAHKTKN